ncbi:MAG TPA: hypothetical protein VLW17_14960, partial [Thermoanaerobaculaceae bacterium]|nr:hypothetical protein [Thermoanaerobaculaceae bacterium]
GAAGLAGEGTSVALSGDGHVALIGGDMDSSGAGAVWMFIRTGGTWSQQGDKVVGTGAVGAAELGASVALSADGTTAIVGGPGDTSGTGAAWVFSSSMYATWIPVVSHSSGLNGSEWRSDLGLLNTGTATANAQLSFYGSSGLVTNTTYVPAGAQSVLTDVVGQLGASGSGAIEVLSDQPLKVTGRSYSVVASATSCYAGGTQVQGYPALASGDGLSAGQSAYLPGLTEDASYHSNIGVVNTGSGAATVLVELFDGTGAKLTDYTVMLNPGKWAQEGQPFKSKAGQTAMDRGYARITVQSGSGVFGFASLIDNVTNSPTTVTMQR